MGRARHSGLGWSGCGSRACVTGHHGGGHPMGGRLDAFHGGSIFRLRGLKRFLRNVVVWCATCRHTGNAASAGGRPVRARSHGSCSSDHGQDYRPSWRVPD
ncbi:hypothetical protein ACCUM_3503 [Candidatus Accumulibacter phosphatis]|uniref:Uncharacterized protein n=1 Tax=Candidatus Accumulibacter phosphatis TaxID=327160 RepID=A0A5S4EP00_9PROT|nr:hypothetical protein ACCUM_3503 [Candidatus Accumulibacter phosphatis]